MKTNSRSHRSSIPPAAQATFVSMNTARVEAIAAPPAGSPDGEMVAGIVADEQGRLPGTSLHAGIFRPSDAYGRVVDGAAWFHFAVRPGEEAAPCLVAVCCWDPALSGEVWLLANARYRGLHHMLNRQVVTPEIPAAAALKSAPPGVWMAEIIYPDAHDLDLDTIRLMKKASRAVFWSLAGA